MGCYVHNVPGRLRVKSELIKKKSRDARQIKKIFSSHYGIDDIRANPLTGSLVIHYDPDVFSTAQLLNILKYNEIIGPNQPVVFEKPISESSTKAGMAVGKAVFSWAVGRALEGSGLGFLAAFI